MTDSTKLIEDAWHLCDQAKLYIFFDPMLSKAEKKRLSKEAEDRYNRIVSKLQEGEKL